MKRIALVFIMIFTCVYIDAQDSFYGTGLLPDDGTYDQLPRKTELLTRDYTVIPSQYSLMKYCPEVKSQSHYGTCTAWATAYAARTVAEAIKWGWTDKVKITQEAFSPLFVYAQIKDKGDNDCQVGSNIYKALQLMKDKGVVKYSSFNALCANYINSELLRMGEEYKIDDFFTLFSMMLTDGNEKIQKVKKAISEDCPVIIAMHLPSSFYSAKENWDGIDANPVKHGYHAMCVIGYDDKRNGGSFQIMNSWGTNWGNNGFVWVRYNDFAKYVDQAYELYVKKNIIPKPSPKPIVQNNLSGEITLQLATGERMVPHFNYRSRSYRIADEYISGTRYRIYISNNQPAYVYVIGSDIRNNVSKVFPPKEGISAALTYKSNHIAIPDEKYYVEMDNNRGTDYMCVLYSKEALNINDIISKIKAAEGSFYEKVKTVLGNKLAEHQDIRYIINNMGFGAITTKTVVPIFVEITHI